MFRAASLEVRSAVTGPAFELLLRKDLDEVHSTPIESRKRRTPAASVLFRDLDPGGYTVIVRGSDPLAQHATKLRLEEGETRIVKQETHASHVVGSVQHGQRALANAHLEFRNRDFGWIGALNADANGEFSSDVWQSGAFFVAISGGNLHNSYMREIRIEQEPLSLVVPTDQIRGRIIDGISGRPVAGAHVMLRLDTTALNQTSDAQGQVVFDAITATRASLTVSAEDYLLPEPVEIASENDEWPQDLVIKLDSGRGWSTRVYDHQGRPLPQAELIAASGNRYRAVARTDSAGRATLPLPDDAVLVYVLGPTGGIAVLNRFDTNRVDMPAPSASLRLIARSTAGTPLPPVSFVISINGWTIPPKVAGRMSRLQGFSMQTDGNGELHLPAVSPGHYELWPYDDSVQAETLFSAPPEAPISVDVKSGPNVFAVDFQQVSNAVARPPN